MFYVAVLQALSYTCCILFYKPLLPGLIVLRLDVPVIRYDLFLFSSWTRCVVIRRIITSSIFPVCMKLAFTHISVKL